jgi:PilZ domain
MLGVQKFVLKIVNNNCPELKALFDGPRNDKRVNLSLVVLVVPLENSEVQVDNAFYAVTRDLSASGLGIILSQQRALDQVLLGFRLEGQLTFVRAKAKHLNPMGYGFYQLGLEMTEIVSIDKYPALKVF